MAFILKRTLTLQKLAGSRSTMAMNPADHLRSLTTCTTPKLAPMAAATATATTHYGTAKPIRAAKEMGEWAPFMVLGVLLVTGISFGVHTAKQQLCHSPTVQVRKKRREMISEVDNPDSVVSSADKFVNKSILRKVAHIQDNSRVPDTGLPNAFTRSREIENLESVGVAYRGRA